MNSRRITVLMVCLVLSLLAAAPYLQTLDYGFIHFDDDQYVYENPAVLSGLNWESLDWALRAVVVGNWHPLTILSHIIDCELYGQEDGTQWVGGHHLTNVVLHAANSLLLLWALWMLTSAFWRPALLAAIFAVHPQHVESVAWIAERKDVLSTFFGFLALGAYGWYAKQPSWRRMGLVTFCLLLSLMSKPMWVTFPCMLLLLDIWPLRRVKIWDIGQSEHCAGSCRVPATSIRAAILEKIPLIALILASSVLTFQVQSLMGAMRPGASLGVLSRLANACVAYMMYLYKLVWPTDLTVYYPHPNIWPVSTLLIAITILLVITTVVIWQRRTSPWMLIGWLLFLGMLVPVIGIVQVGAQFMADRYMYVPSVWATLLILWGISSLQARMRNIAVGVACVLVLALGVSCYSQVGYWKDTITLFTHTLSLTEKNAIAHLVLADTYAAKNDPAKAEHHFKEGLAAQPHFEFAYERYALFLKSQERYGEALDILEKQMGLKESAFPPNQAGLIHMKRGELELAERAFLRALELDPFNLLKSRENLANMYLQQGKIADAYALTKQALIDDASSFEAHNTLGALCILEQKWSEAEVSLRHAVELEPDNWQAQANHGRVLVELERYDDAIGPLTRAQEGHPERLFIRTNLARALAATGRTDEAVAILQDVLVRSPGFAPAVTALSQIQSAAPSSSPGS